ncbi:MULTISPECIES: aldo/keto reductase [Sanguibacteroides]|uniref:2,5-diketo-D-gluconic acid reductase n=1 Tax=Sanguibacteroides justesenii TaxID=1547597 RepID=A0A0C3RFU5_9PORP|nr:MULTISPECIES: aldo/keto reductase [Sanguibacteroides]KIO45701.1 2,5-diketo-D-gluconic acid reductase [Sanguibacteroides justesenii]
METVKLHNGVEMPILGYGVYQVTPEECERCVTDALRVGYRLIDTAQAYFNEQQVGDAIRKSGIARGEIFLTTKIWITNGGEKKAMKSINESLLKLQTDYVDLLLIHQPFGDYYGTYRAMEAAYNDGKTRAIGVSNFYPDRFIDLAEHVKIKPMVNQVETHVFNQQFKAQEIMEKYGTRIMSWGPFAEGRNNMFHDPTLMKIGNEYGKTAAQVALRYLIQRGVIVIPKSTRMERMRQNMEVFDFTLADDDMSAIAALDEGKTLFFPHYDPEFVNFLLTLKAD